MVPLAAPLQVTLVELFNVIKVGYPSHEPGTGWKPVAASLSVPFVNHGAISTVDNESLLMKFCAAADPYQLQLA